MKIHDADGYIKKGVLFDATVDAQQEKKLKTARDYLEFLHEFPTADVVPRSEHDALLHRYELAVSEREANVKGFSEMLHKQKIDLAKEIFREVSKISVPANLPTAKIDWNAFMELRTRYTKEEV